MKIEPEAKISERLRYAMQLRNLRQVDLVERTKIPKASIHQYLTDYAEPKSDRIYLLARALDVSPIWLMGLNVPMENKAPVRNDLIIEKDEIKYLIEVANNMSSDELFSLIRYAEFLKGEGK